MDFATLMLDFTTTVSVRDDKDGRMQLYHSWVAPDGKEWVYASLHDINDDVSKYFLQVNAVFERAVK